MTITSRRHISEILGFGHMRAQYAANAAGLRKMADKAKATGKKVGGFTFAVLDERATEFARLAGLDDAALEAHIASCNNQMAARLAELRGTK